MMHNSKVDKIVCFREFRRKLIGVIIFSMCLSFFVGIMYFMVAGKNVASNHSMDYIFNTAIAVTYGFVLFAPIAFLFWKLYAFIEKITPIYYVEIDVNCVTVHGCIESVEEIGRAINYVKKIRPGYCVDYDWFTYDPMKKQPQIIARHVKLNRVALVHDDDLLVLEAQDV